MLRQYPIPTAAPTLHWTGDLLGFRPLLGKSDMSALIGQAREDVMRLIRQYPQCAFLRGRSAGTALRVVHEHCHAVRDACSKVRLNVHQQHQGQTRAVGSGGLQLSLDLTAAFDLIHWSDVKQALSYAGVNIATQEIIILWLSQFRYLFRHKHM